MSRVREWLEDFLGAPAFVTLGVLLWMQQKPLHQHAPNLLLAADRALVLPGLPPLAGYALLGAIIAITISLYRLDGKVISGPLRWRALIIPVVAGLIYWFWFKR